MKYALITGASSGIGTEFARVYASKGYNLVLAARSADKLQALADELSAKHSITVNILTVDLSKPEAPQQLFEFTHTQGIAITDLVNNASFADYGEFGEADWAKNAEMINLNIKTLTHLSYLFLPDMMDRKSGRILNMISI